MEVITKANLIANVAEHWLHQYGGRVGQLAPEFKAIYHKLVTLPANATEDMVAYIIGNRSWIRNLCNECKEDVDVVVIVGEEPACESDTAQLCLNCLRKAVSLAEDELLKPHSEESWKEMSIGPFPT